MIALLLTIGAGLAVAPLIIVAVVVAYLTSLGLTAYVDERIGIGRPILAPRRRRPDPAPAALVE